jgi:hypothetical protein
MNPKISSDFLRPPHGIKNADVAIKYRKYKSEHAKLKMLPVRFDLTCSGTLCHLTTIIFLQVNSTFFLLTQMYKYALKENVRHNSYIVLYKKT